MDRCTESHKAANDKRNQSTWKGCDDTGLMGCCCRHDAAISMLNIHKSGEQRALPLTLVDKLLKSIEPERPVGILYDIGCSLDKFIQLVTISFNKSPYSGSVIYTPLVHFVVSAESPASRSRTIELWNLSVPCLCPQLDMPAGIQPTIQHWMGIVGWRRPRAYVVLLILLSKSPKVCN
jgi:hypothetical protein